MRLIIISRVKKRFFNKNIHQRTRTLAQGKYYLKMQIFAGILPRLMFQLEKDGFIQRKVIKP